MDNGLKCWKCGASLADYTLPLRRLEECRACEFYDTSKAKHCQEPIADEVKDKIRANFCDYFRPTPAAWRPEQLSAADQARAQLEALFGRK